MRCLQHKEQVLHDGLQRFPALRLRLVVLTLQRARNLLALHEGADKVREAEELETELDCSASGALPAGEQLPLLHVADVVDAHERGEGHLLKQLEDPVEGVRDPQAGGEAHDDGELFAPPVRPPRPCELCHGHSRVRLQVAQRAPSLGLRHAREAHDGARDVLEESGNLVAALGLGAENIEVGDDVHPFEGSDALAWTWGRIL
mmetsp:Transcript_77337/g.202962  ORF Transcript_77337/g.202962 Transcript_77337/m.202962 type:complete len:203 (+) Transcript_77337:305-913(+)